MKRRVQLAVIALFATGAAAQDIKPFQAQEVKPFQAQEIKPVQAQDIKPVQSQGIQRFAADSVKPGCRYPDPPRRQVTVEEVAPLIGAWQSNVMGAVWTSPSSIPGWDRLNVAPGALAGLLVIYPNGTYVWNSYGGKKGRWVTTDTPTYPIVLKDTVENREWAVGLDVCNPGTIFIADGTGLNYSARRASRR